MTTELVGKDFPDLRKELSAPAFAFFAVVMLITPMTNAPYAIQVEGTPAARAAALAGTRQMIRDDEFSVLVALLVDCGAVPRNVMAATLRRMADVQIAKARGLLESNFQIYPAELFDRARSLTAMAVAFERGARGAGANQ
jgi:hypothetical protein